MKEVTFKEKAREGLKAGVDLIANAVKSTLGPRGRNVVYGFHYGFPVCTKDGVTVAKQVESQNQLEQLGVLLIREVAQKTADDTGDGTTTASVLAQAIFTEGLRSISSGANPILIKRGIDKAVNDVVAWIEGQSIDVKGSLTNVANVSANNDEAVGKLVTDSIEKVGEDGVITIEDSVNEDSSIEIIEGMQLNEGYMSPFFMTDKESTHCVYKDPYILLVDGTIDNPSVIKSIIEKAIGEEKRPLAIICHGLGPVAMQALVSNRINHGLPLVVCKASQFANYRSELMQDVAILTGATVVSSMTGLPFSDLALEHLGTCETFTATKSYTNIVGGGGDKEALKGRVNELEKQMADAISDYDKEKTQERYAKLTSGVAVIKVGASTEVEQKEKKMRVEDALCATKSALEGGIVPGGGTMYFKACKVLEGFLANAS